MENLTHSLLGAAFAELALPADASPARRRLYFVSGVVAANLLDADLLYTRITPPPLGYLLHHRGHTHTIVGCVLLAGLIWAVTAIVPAFRKLVAETPRAFWAMIGAALLSHVFADWWNSYGVHPFWPIDNRWFYGDAIFIAEPWFWIMLGIPAIANTRNVAGRWVLVVLFVLAAAAVTRFGMITSSTLIPLAVGAVVLTAVLLRLRPHARSTVGLVATLVFVAGSFGLGHVVRSRAVATIGALSPDQRGEILDIVLSPRGARPLCWTALSVERVAATNEYLLRRGEIAVSPNVDRCGINATSGDRWDAPLRESALALRERSTNDCRVRAWLQFGRTPLMRSDLIVDFRYGGPNGGNFTQMELFPLSESASCPPHLTSWGMPRADLLSPP